MRGVDQKIYQDWGLKSKVKVSDKKLVDMCTEGSEIFLISSARPRMIYLFLNLNNLYSVLQDIYSEVLSIQAQSKR